jgi:hypothetical protein
MKHKEIYGRARQVDNWSIRTQRNKRPLLVLLWYCANMLAIFLPNGIYPSNNNSSH